MMAMDPSPFLNVAIDNPVPNMDVDATVAAYHTAHLPLTRAEKPARDQFLADRRMELFVTQICTFYASVIFPRVPRLQRDGYRWAQRSFLGHPLGATPLEWSHAEVCQVGSAGGIGLKVKYPGVSLNTVAALEGVLGSVFVVFCEQDRFQIELFHNLDGEPTRWDARLRYCVIMRAKPSDIGTRSVEVMLGSWDRHDVGPSVVRFESCGTATSRRADKHGIPEVCGP
jgi:hypothetical protein